MSLRTADEYARKASTELSFGCCCYCCLGRWRWRWANSKSIIPDCTLPYSALPYPYSYQRTLTPYRSVVIQSLSLLPCTHHTRLLICVVSLCRSRLVLLPHWEGLKLLIHRPPTLNTAALRGLLCVWRSVFTVHHFIRPATNQPKLDYACLVASACLPAAAAAASTRMHCSHSDYSTSRTTHS